VLGGGIRCISTKYETLLEVFALVYLCPVCLRAISTRYHHRGEIVPHEGMFLTRLVNRHVFHIYQRRCWHDITLQFINPVQVRMSFTEPLRSKSCKTSHSHVIANHAGCLQ